MSRVDPIFHRGTSEGSFSVPKTVGFIVGLNCQRQLTLAAVTSGPEQRPPQQSIDEQAEPQPPSHLYLGQHDAAL
nr:hypothetical protein HmN_000956900 [Hymenolepis microstoma]